MAREQPCKNAVAWLRTNKHDLAGLTGQDYRALLAIAHTWELYAVGDDAGREMAIRAIKALVRAMQPKYTVLARELIAWAMDWDDRDRLWPIATEGSVLFWPVQDG